MDHFDDQGVGVVPALPIPAAGLTEVLAAWSGRGYLWEILAQPVQEQMERRWEPRDIQCRAHRVLLERLKTPLGRWPTRTATWMDVLPATNLHERATFDTPCRSISWPATRIRYGWPPSRFVGRESERRADMLLVTCLRWVVERLLAIRDDAARAHPDAVAPVQPQLDAAFALLNFEPLASAVGGRPGHADLIALKAAGTPWTAVAAVAEVLCQVDSSIETLARILLKPDDEIRWRLFHLGVLGVLLQALGSCGCHVTSLRPFGAMSRGPAYRITDALKREWDLWFEGSGIWAHQNIRSPYLEATHGLPGGARSLGADLLLLRPGHEALIIECKYSSSPEVVGRDAYYQATTYATEVRSRLAQKVRSVVVAPSGVITTTSFTETFVGPVGTTNPEDLPAIVRSVLGAK